MLDEHLRVRPVIWGNCDSDPDAQPCRDMIDQERLSDGCCDASRDPCCIIERADIWRDDSEFVTSNAGEDRTRSHDFGDSLGELRQSLIADRVAAVLRPRRT